MRVTNDNSARRLLWIVNTYSEFQANIFSNRDVKKCHSFYKRTITDNDNAKAIAIPRVFSENSRANKNVFQSKQS